MKTLSALVLAALLAFPLASCDDKSEGPITVGPASGVLVHATSCKQTAGLPASGAGSASESCVEFVYMPESRTLTLRHVNAGFNCCPGELSATFSVENGVITITEKEREAGCHCDCLYDLDFRIDDLTPAAYRIVLVEPYKPDGAEALDFTVDLRQQTSGTHCSVRTSYPWGM